MVAAILARRAGLRYVLPETRIPSLSFPVTAAIDASSDQPSRVGCSSCSMISAVRWSGGMKWS